ncbi:trimeric intracellular cation channel family protein [Halobacteriovorax marinus]|uniref:trimeric intracellular cation channel family protein n=1 Tax=Halobacteriovorax marinus TaxID=97084 RepID=UPI003A8D321A
MSEIFNYIDYIGTFVFAVTGASIAGKSKFDLFGMLFLAFLTSVGGGTVRDLVIGQPVFWTNNSTYLYLIFIATLSTFFLVKIYDKNKSLLMFLDTLGVGTFGIIGTHKTLIYDFNAETALIMGTISAVLGGILRSAFSKEHSILANKELYATVAAVASLIFIALTKAKIEPNICALIVIIATFLIRYISLKFKIQLPSLK